ncbi:sorting nexin-15 isoform X4 [Lagenorhynchus albirostris]|uniref:sorting nexin-15 isoform X4 n=1 Tax=Lagenorhynchus albirostris TaxID=27610 RepID=UPI0028E23DCE|nr:sorting nexin-15 isoform X4 [Lagenorhynchus albirostris]
MSKGVSRGALVWAVGRDTTPSQTPPACTPLFACSQESDLRVCFVFLSAVTAPTHLRSSNKSSHERFTHGTAFKLRNLVVVVLPKARPLCTPVPNQIPETEFWAKDDFLRHYTVSDPRTHPKGYTEYKVTAQFISKRDPEDVKEVVVWKRYSDFRKLHGDLAYTHRNLFRRLEEFPAFPRAQVFGRFEASVIEERRKGAEDLLRFTVHIPALNNSPQLKEFFRGGEVTRPSEMSRDVHILPPPLIPTPPPDEPRVQPHEPWLPQPLPAERRGLEELEVPGMSPMIYSSVDPLPSSPAQEALDLLFNCGSTEEASSSPGRGPLTEAELALFDPFSKEGDPSPARREGVKKKAAEYLKRAEEILHLHLSQLPP